MSRLTRDFFGGIPQSATGRQPDGDDWVYGCRTTGCEQTTRWRERPNLVQVCPDHPDRAMACVNNPLEVGKR
jgi:hypothetical protein